VPPGIDTAKANVAHAHDYWPGGNHNFRAGRPEGLRKYRAHVGVGVKPTFAPITRSEYGR
jgi:hypothetical protein